MAAIQETSAHLRRVRCRDVAGNLRAVLSRFLYILVSFLFATNTLNNGANIEAMNAAVQLFLLRAVRDPSVF
jgi:hypothetical protein